MKHFLVTGGFGFIGQHLVRRLLADNHHVHVVDDLRSSLMTERQIERWAKQSGGRLTYNIETVARYTSRGKRGVRCDGIFHLASPVGAAWILEYAGEMAKQILDDTLAVIGEASIFDCRLVYVSTSEVYGGGVNGFCTEDTPCVVPIHTPTVRLEYAIGKLAGEIAVLNAFNVDPVIIRPFNVAGAYQNADLGFVLPRFIQQALGGQSLTVFGDGSQIRAFTHVADIVDGLMLAMERAPSRSVYNLGNPANETTVLALAERVIALLGGEITFTTGQAVYGERWAEAANKIPDASKAIAELGWNPTRDIDTIISEAVAVEMWERA